MSLWDKKDPAVGDDFLLPRLDSPYSYLHCALTALIPPWWWICIHWEIHWQLRAYPGLRLKGKMEVMAHCCFMMFGPGISSKLTQWRLLSLNAHTLHCALRIWLPGYGPASASCCISTHAAFGSCVLMHALKVPPRHRDPFDLQSTLECSLRPLGLGSAWPSKGWYCKCGYGKTAKPCKKHARPHLIRYLNRLKQATKTKIGFYISFKRSVALGFWEITRPNSTSWRVAFLLVSITSFWALPGVFWREKCCNQRGPKSRP